MTQAITLEEKGYISSEPNRDSRTLYQDKSGGGAVRMVLDFYGACYVLLTRCPSGEMEVTHIVDALMQEYPDLTRLELNRAVTCLIVDHKNRASSHPDHRTERQIPTPQHDLLKIAGTRGGHYRVRLYSHAKDGYWGMKRTKEGFKPCQLDITPSTELLAAYVSHRASAEAFRLSSAAQGLLTRPLRRRRPKKHETPRAVLEASALPEPPGPDQPPVPPEGPSEPPEFIPLPVRPAPQESASVRSTTSAELTHPLGAFCSLGATLLQFLKDPAGQTIEGTTTFGTDSLEFLGRQADGAFLCVVVLAAGTLPGCMKAVARMSVAAAFAGLHVRKILVVPSDVPDAVLATLRDASPDVALLTYATTLLQP